MYVKIIEKLCVLTQTKNASVCMEMKSNNWGATYTYWCLLASINKLLVRVRVHLRTSDNIH